MPDASPDATELFSRKENEDKELSSNEWTACGIKCTPLSWFSPPKTIVFGLRPSISLSTSISSLFTMVIVTINCSTCRTRDLVRLQRSSESAMVAESECSEGTGEGAGSSVSAIVAKSELGAPWDSVVGCWLWSLSGTHSARWH